MSEHTPGPWTLQPLEDNFAIGGVNTLGHQRIVGADCISPGVVFGGVRECDYNASLIQAAPDLLAALHELLGATFLPDACTHGEEPDYCDSCLFEQQMAVGRAAQKARAAIDKAEGR